MTLSKRSALAAGLAYAGMAVAGVLSTFLARPHLYVPGDAAATAANLVAHPGLAHLGIAADLGIVLTQALAALWFFTLFRRVDVVAAGAVAVFGTVNAVIILVGTMFSATAFDVAIDGAGGATGDPATTTLLLYDLNAAAWDLGGLFFGLWLIPMGWAAVRSTVMPRALGWILMAGGVGYIASAFVASLVDNATTVTTVLTVPASVGEFWMIGYLLVLGLGRPIAGPGHADATPTASAGPR